ncbi:hypothetical protein A2U01_0058247, partial [Trifolium medium]|nr:hypothetical protein [Trifolium medium]
NNPMEPSTSNADQVLRAGFPSSTMIARVISHLDIFSKW